MCMLEFSVHAGELDTREISGLGDILWSSKYLLIGDPSFALSPTIRVGKWFFQEQGHDSQNEGQEDKDLKCGL